MTPPPTTPVIAQDIAVTCVDVHGRQVELPTTLVYRTQDPYAVTMIFHSGLGEAAWVIGRDLLAQGLVGPSGEGDIRIRPVARTGASPVAVLDLRPPEGRMVATARLDELQRFVDGTLAAVPLGAESEHLDIDRLVGELLADTPRTH